MNTERSPLQTISVIIPALNEEENLEASVESVRSVLNPAGHTYEILIFDDGSTDGTGRLSDELAKAYPEIRVVHQSRPQGLGACYRRGVELATAERVVIIPGDNQVPAAALALMYAEMDAVDIVVPYFVNSDARSASREAISGLFTRLVNTLFGLNLRYYNGPCIHRRSLVLAAMPKTNGFAYMAVLLVRLVSSGYTVKEVGIELRARESGRSKAFGFKNFASIGFSLLTLLFETRILNRRWGGSMPSPVIAVHKTGTETRDGAVADVARQID